MASAAPTQLHSEEQSSRLTLTPVARAIAAAVIVAIATASYIIISRQGVAPRLYNPLLIALLLVANLIAGSALLVLLGRGLARRRAARSPLGGGGQLHVRLVALFSMAAAVPMILVAIVASLLFQYGIQFWYSDQARSVMGNASQIARSSYDQTLDRWRQQTATAAYDTAAYLHERSVYSPDTTPFLLQQIYYRSMSDGVLFRASASSGFQTFAMVNPDRLEVEREVTPAQLARLRAGERPIVTVRRNRVQVLSPVPGIDNLFLFTAAATINMEPILRQRESGMLVERQYRELIGQARSLQLRFHAALLALSLLIVGVAVWIALRLADRLIQPVTALVGAARRVEGGDLTARVADTPARDELGTLSRTFNQMTDRLEQQTAALDQRRALIEAVMAGVSAGVVATGADRTVTIANSSAARLLASDALVGRSLADVVPALDQLVRDRVREAIVQVGSEGEARTLAVRLQHGDTGAILTFDDITQQQNDQRRAAWADVARRIAHEIKNPLTPIQLAAERLQRRYGGKVDAGDPVFSRLTETIVRQVGDLRRMVDEFSSFARMPKPVFQDESLTDIARQTIFLHEVAHPCIRFSLDAPDPAPHMVCDRRLLGQALTNIVKNAVEAVEATGRDDGMVAVMLRTGQGHAAIEVADNGIGLPADRERIVEPYVTTRARGTGLGLAIVKKIVEDHHGIMSFSDRPGGGSVVGLSFDVAALAAMAGADEGATGSGETIVAQLATARA